MTVAKYGALWRELLLLLCLAFFLTGCTGGKPATDPVTLKDPVPADSLKAIFSLTIHSPDGKSHDLDAVLFSVPNKRYRMELTGSLGIGVASLRCLASVARIWLADGFPDGENVHGRRGIYGWTL